MLYTTFLFLSIAYVEIVEVSRWKADPTSSLKRSKTADPTRGFFNSAFSEIGGVPLADHQANLADCLSSLAQLH